MYFRSPVRMPTCAIARTANAVEYIHFAPGCLGSRSMVVPCGCRAMIESAVRTDHGRTSERLAVLLAQPRLVSRSNSIKPGGRVVRFINSARVVVAITSGVYARPEHLELS